MEKSIFEFSDKFDVDSPFGNWIEDLKKESIEKELDRVKNGSPQVYDRSEPLTTTSLNGSGICGSMVILSNIVDPINEQPGSATIEINMNYKVVTSGEGAIGNPALINTSQFSKLFSKGNRVIKLKRLPSKKEKALTLTSKEYRQSRRIDKTTGNPKFWNYYSVKIEYNFGLESKSNFTLWDGIKWLKKCIETNGIFYLLPYESYVEKWYKAKNKLTTKQIKDELSDEEKKDCTEDDLKILVKLKTYDYLREMQAQFISFTIRNLILDNKVRYKDKRIFIKNGSFYVSNNEFIFSNQELNKVLQELGSTFHSEKTTDYEDSNWVELLDFDLYYSNYVEPIVNFAILFFPEFKKGGIGTPEIGAAGSNESLISSEANFVALNPKFFGKKSVGTPFKFGGMTATEVLVHESGHNAAANFKHKTGDYEYDQQGLQSNEHNKIYPSFENTIGILNVTT